jgi:hypothetical protein
MQGHCGLYEVSTRPGGLQEFAATTCPNLQAALSSPQSLVPTCCAPAAAAAPYTPTVRAARLSCTHRQAEATAVKRAASGVQRHGTEQAFWGVSAIWTQPAARVRFSEAMQTHASGPPLALRTSKALGNTTGRFTRGRRLPWAIPAARY